MNNLKPEMAPSKKRKQIVKTSSLPVFGRQAQRDLAKIKMLERIEKIKEKKEEK